MRDLGRDKTSFFNKLNTVLSSLSLLKYEKSGFEGQTRLQNPVMIHSSFIYIYGFNLTILALNQGFLSVVLIQLS